MLHPIPWTPDFDELKKVLAKEKPSRPVLFEFIFGDEKLKLLAGKHYDLSNDYLETFTKIKAFENGGYDYVPLLVKGMMFPRNAHEGDSKETISLNVGSMITNREDFDNYHWPTTSQCDVDLIKKAGEHLPPKMKFITYSYDGILENAIGIVGYEALCMLMYDDQPLFEDIFKKIGEITESYYLKTLVYEEVGAIIINDDWGFNAQTMFPPDVLRKNVFPWVKRIVQAAHDVNKPVLLHSCGYYGDIIEDIINDLKIDGRHSYEDNIIPVEKAYQTLNQRIAVMGGLDVDFLTRSSKEAIYQRAYAMLEASAQKGAYALGSGNSIPNYVPDEHYLAMRQAAIDYYQKNH